MICLVSLTIEWSFLKAFWRLFVSQKSSFGVSVNMCLYINSFSESHWGFGTYSMSEEIRYVFRLYAKVTWPRLSQPSPLIGRLTDTTLALRRFSGIGLVQADHCLIYYLILSYSCSAEMNRSAYAANWCTGFIFIANAKAVCICVVSPEILITHTLVKEQKLCKSAKCQKVQERFASLFCFRERVGTLAC